MVPRPFRRSRVRRVSAWLGAGLSAGVLSLTAHAAGDWPAWRGPTRDGIAAPNQNPPIRWSASENIVWRAPIPGRGHSSPTVVGNRVYLIGNLGYPQHRRAGQTQVYVLDLETWRITPVATSGTPPGWICEHQAALTDDGAAILVTGGKLDTGSPDTSLVENLDDWCLHLVEGRWERRTVRDWPRWEVRRNDGGRLHLFEYQTALWEMQYGAFRHPSLEVAGVKFPTLDEELGGAPDLTLFPNRFRPELPHEVPERPPEEDFRVHRIRVAGVGVRYVEGHSEIQMTVEGHLPDDVLARLVSDLEDKLARLERHPCKARVLRVG